MANAQVIDLATISTDGNTDVEIPVDGYGWHPEMVLQIGISGTITIQVLGSLDDATYVEVLAESSESQLEPIALMPWLRFTASSTSGGTATIKAMIARAPMGR